MTHTDLRGCPWCGQQPCMEPEDPETQGDAWTRISCQNPECIAECQLMVCGDHDHEAEAITAWNTRARTPDTAPNQSADLIVEAEQVRDWMKRQDLKFSWQTVDNLITALRAAEAENARLSEENRALRTNYRSGTFGDLNASDMRNIPDQEDDVSEAQEWEDFDRDC